MAQLVDDPIVPEEEKTKSKAVQKRKYTHQVVRKGLAASSIAQVRSVLSRNQLLQCADAYVNNGIVRVLVDKMVFFIKGERTGFVIEPNEELTVSATDDETKTLNQQIQDDTLEFNGKPVNVKELRRKLIRINKRVKLHDRLDKLLTSTILFGRNGLEIIRLPKTSAGDDNIDEEGNPKPEWTVFGEPIALRHLNSVRLVDVQVDATTAGFKGFFYDEGSGAGLGVTKRFIKSDNLIPAFHDDNNLYDNTNYSGLSAVWPILSIAQADDVINDEDIPEQTRNLSSNFGIIYPGSSAQSDIDETRDQLQQGSWLVTGKPEFKAEVHSLGRDPMELTNLRNADAKYMTMCLSLPLFLLFEDTANFATANQVMQVYKSGMLKRYRTWLQGILEDYWYDTILADHLGIPLKDVITAPIKIKAIFPDINFETRKDVITADQMLFTMGVMNETDVAKDIDRKDIAQRLEEEQSNQDQAIRDQRQQSINQTVAQRNNNNNGNDPNAPQDQQANQQPPR